MAAAAAASTRAGVEVGASRKTKARPWRAARANSLMYFEKSLPRAWSVAAFLRLIVAHLEWPDVALPRH